MRTLFYGLVFIIIGIPNAQALGLNSGGELLEACSTTKQFLAGESIDEQKATACVHFLMGFDSGQAIVSSINEITGVHCAPDGTNIGDMVNAVVTYIEANAGMHEAPAGIAAWQAMNATYPCN